MKAVGVSVRDSENEFRDLTDILADLGKVWNSLSSVEQSNISYNVAGIRQTNILKSLLANWEDYKDLVETAGNSTGTTLKNQEIHAESLKGKIQELKSVWQGIGTETFESGMMKGFVDIGTAISNVVRELGLLQSALVVVGGYKFFNNFKDLQAIGADLTKIARCQTLFNKAVSDATTTEASYLAILQSVNAEDAQSIVLKSALSNHEKELWLTQVGLSESEAASAVAQMAFNKAVLSGTATEASYLAILEGVNTEEAKSIIIKSALSKQEKEQILVKIGLSEADAVATAGQTSLNTAETVGIGVTTALSNAFKGLYAVMMKHPVIAIIGLVAAGLYATSKAVLAFSNTEEKQIEKNNELLSSFQQLESEQKSLHDQLVSNVEKLKELQAIESPTIIEQGEIDKLRESNRELEDRITLLNQEKEIKQQEINQGVQEAYNLGFQTKKTGITENSKYRSDKQDYNYETDQWEYTYEATEEEVYNDKLARAKELIGLGKDRTKQEENELKILKEQIGETARRIDTEISGYKATTEEEKRWLAERKKQISEASFIVDPTQYKQNRFDEVWNSKDFEKQREELESLAKTGKLDDSVLESNEKYRVLLDETSASADELTKHINSLCQAQEKASKVATIKPFSKSEMISAINEMSEGFEELDKIMQSQKGKDPFNFALLDDKKFKDTFENIPEIKKEYEDFVETISSSPKDIKACQDAYDNLISKWIQSTGILDKVDESNANLTKSMLENMGVANADEMVHDALIKVKVREISETKKLVGATQEEINNLADEAKVVDEDRDKFRAYILQKSLDEPIPVGGDLANLKTLCEALGVATKAWDAYWAAKEHNKSLVSKNGFAYDASSNSLMLNEDGSAMTYQQAKSYWKSNEDAARKQLEEDLAKYIDQADYVGGNKTNKSSGSSSGSSGSKSTKDEDYISRRLKILEDARAEALKIAQSDYLSYKGLKAEDVEDIKELIKLFDSGKVVGEENFDFSKYEKLQKALKQTGLSYEQLREKILNGDYLSRQSGFEQVLEYDKKLLEEYTIAAKDYYAEYLEAVAKLPNEVRQKIENGGYTVDTYSGSQAKEVEKAMKALDNYKSMQSKVGDTKKSIAEDNKSIYENEVSYLDAQNKELSNKQNLLQSEISYLETIGGMVSADSYMEIIGLLDSQIDILEDKKDAVERELQALLDAGLIDEESPLFYALSASIEECDIQISNFRKSQAEANEKIKEMPYKQMEYLTSLYDRVETAIDNVKSEFESAGKVINKSYYESQISNANRQINRLEEQRNLAEEIRDTYDVGTDKWNAYNDKIISIDESMSSLVQKTYDWQNALLNLPIDNLQKVIDLQGKVSDVLSNIEAEYKATGKVVNKEYYIALISNADRELAYYKQQRDAVNNLLSKYDVGSDLWIEAYNKLQDINSSISTITQNTAEWNNAIANLSISNIQQILDIYGNIETSISNIEAEFKAAGKVVSSDYYNLLIQNAKKELESYEKQKTIVKELLNTYEAGSDLWKETYSQLTNIDSSISTINQNISAWNESLQKMPINRLEQSATLYEKISSYIQSYGSVVEASGQSLTTDYYNSLINNGKSQITVLQNQMNLLTNLRDSYEIGSDKWVEANNQVLTIKESINSVVQSMYSWNNSILELSYSKLEDVVNGMNLLKDALSDLHSDQNTVISSVNRYLDEQNEILQDKLDLINEQNEALKVQQNLEKAKYDLEKAQNQLTQMVVRNGQTVYEADIDAIKEASQSLADAELESQKYEIQKQIDAINDIKKNWSDITDAASNERDDNVTSTILGEDWKDLNKLQDDTYRELFEEQYKQTDNQIAELEQQIDNQEDAEKLIKLYISAYKSGTISQENAMEAINTILSKTKEEITSGQNVKNILAYLNTTQKVGTTTADAITGLKKETETVWGQFTSAFDTFWSNTQAITDYVDTVSQVNNTTSEIVGYANAILQENTTADATMQRKVDELSGYVNQVNDSVNGSSEGLKNEIATRTGDIVNSVGSVYNALNSNTRTLQDAISDATDSIYSGLNEIADAIGALDLSSYNELENDLEEKNHVGTDKSGYVNSGPGANLGSNYTYQGGGGATYTTSGGSTVVVAGSQKRKDGIESGAVKRVTPTEAERELYNLSTKDINEGITMVGLHPDEVVLNTTQQGQLVDNVLRMKEMLAEESVLSRDYLANSIGSLGDIINMATGYVNPISHAFSASNMNTKDNSDVNITFDGDIVLKGVQNVDAFANALSMNIGRAMNNAVSKQFNRR